MEKSHISGIRRIRNHVGKPASQWTNARLRFRHINFTRTLGGRRSSLARSEVAKRGMTICAFIRSKLLEQIQSTVPIDVQFVQLDTRSALLYYLRGQGGPTKFPRKPISRILEAARIHGNSSTLEESSFDCIDEIVLRRRIDRGNVVTL